MIKKIVKTFTIFVAVSFVLLAVFSIIDFFSYYLVDENETLDHVFFHD